MLKKNVFEAMNLGGANFCYNFGTLHVEGIKNNIAEHFQIYAIGPSEVRALPVRRCRRAAWQTLVATINGIFLSFFFFFLIRLLFSQKGLT
jgi:hypothetical protein